MEETLGGGPLGSVGRLESLVMVELLVSFITYYRILNSVRLVNGSFFLIRMALKIKTNYLPFYLCNNSTLEKILLLQGLNLGDQT